MLVLFLIILDKLSENFLWLQKTSKNFQKKIKKEEDRWRLDTSEKKRKKNIEKIKRFNYLCI